jgi:hypothetical protein
MHTFIFIFKASHMLGIDPSLIANYTFIHTPHISGRARSMWVGSIAVIGHDNSNR